MKPTILVVLLVAILLAACAMPARPPSLAQPNPAEPVVSPARATLNKPVLVEFYSTICAICKQIKPAVSRLEEEYQDRVEFKMYDAAGLNEDIRRQYAYMAYPQFVILDAQGEIRFNRFGYQTYDSLKSDLESVLSQR